MIKAIVTDIEGTTTQLSFVKEVLFPFAYDQLPSYIETHREEERIQKILQEARAELQNEDVSLTELIQQFLTWIEQDKKITPLKTLQGYIWEEGYKSGKLKSHVYMDAVVELIAWHREGIMLAIFSSGSILAQKLLFSYTEHGDLTYLFSHYFDTTTGPKNSKEAYQKIAQTLGIAPNEILFLSDVVAELDAAKEAGMQVCGLAREGKAPASEHEFVADFFSINKER